ncbi:BPSL0761 family protein [Variovorax sp. ZS18.2.2]|uniref:BPSL0761 family protein n=1 Tax=Variovorax sp. ZS18.2.2 TaxID=2971255 RepID=UPI0035B4E216
MTLPYERRRALQWAGETLRDLRSPHKDVELWGAPVPEKLRQLAIRILRHYPEPWQIAAATRMDDVAVSDWIAGEPDR